jgi:hypothetical protein
VSVFISIIYGFVRAKREKGRKGKGGRGQTHHLMHLSTTDLLRLRLRQIRVVLIVRTTRSLIRRNSRRFRIRIHTAQPAQHPALAVHCAVLALRCGAVCAEELAAAVEHDCYHEASDEYQAENYAQYGCEE